MQRRIFLKCAGVVAVAVVGGGVWRAYDQGVFSSGEGPAFEPWKNWRSDAGDGLLALVPGKLGPISVEPGPELLARVDLAQGPRVESELYDAIPRRHTNRGSFDPSKPLPPEFVSALSGLASDETDVKIFLFSAEADRKKIVEISAPANVELYSDPDIDRGSGRWIRIQWSSVQKYRDGLTIDAFGLPPIGTAVAKFIPLWMLRRAMARQPKNAYADLMLSAPLIGIITVRDRYDRENCLRAGRIWQRAHLLATARGVAGRPCNEAVEMIDHEKVLGRPPRGLGLLNELIGDAAWQPTFIFYMGYPKWTARASPRRPVEGVVLPSA